MPDAATADPSARKEPRARPADALLQPGRNCWRIERATRLAFLVDGEAFFGAVRMALANARHSFYILGWDINSRMRLVPGGADDGLPEPLGPFLNELIRRRPGLRGYVLAWDFAFLYAFEREWWSFLRFNRPKGLAFRLDSRHPLGASHHQKVIVVDDAVAFASGFDLTTSRWDTSEHARDNPLRENPGGGSYAPFHDVGAMVEGACARALGDLCRERWRRVTGREAAPTPELDASPWPASVTPDLSGVDVAIARTEPPYENSEAVCELQALHLDAIARARRFVFAENQYFTSTIVADAFARRMAEPDPPEIALVVPSSESGWLETSTMGVLRARVHAKLRAADRSGRYGMYCPTHAGARDDPGCCINVHSKVLIVDDEFLTLGSANLANRSLRLDTECNLALEARGEPRVRKAIAALRARLLGEHLDADPETVLRATASERSLHSGIELLQKPDRRHLMRIEPEVDQALDAIVPDHEVIDPDEPLDPQHWIEDLLPARRTRSKVRGRVLAIMIVALAAGGLALAWRYTPLSELLAPDRLLAIAEMWRGSPWAPLVAILAFVALGVILVPLTVMIALSAALFGPFEGAAVAFAGALASGAATFALGKLLERYVVRYLRGRRLDWLSRRLAQRGLVAVLIVRLLPIAPYSIVNIVAGASHIGWRDFLLGTALGLAPGLILLSAFVDRAIAAIVSPSATSIALLAVVLAAIVATGVALRRRFGREFAQDE